MPPRWNRILVSLLAGGFLLTTGCGGPRTPDKLKYTDGRVIEGYLKTRKFEVTWEETKGVMKYKYKTVGYKGSIRRLVFNGPSRLKIVATQKVQSKTKNKKVYKVSSGKSKLNTVEFEKLDGTVLNVPTDAIHWIKMGHAYAEEWKAEAGGAKK